MAEFTVNGNTYVTPGSVTGTVTQGTTGPRFQGPTRGIFDENGTRVGFQQVDSVYDLDPADFAAMNVKQDPQLAEARQVNRGWLKAELPTLLEYDTNQEQPMWTVRDDRVEDAKKLLGMTHLTPGMLNYNEGHHYNPGDAANEIRKLYNRIDNPKLEHWKATTPDYEGLAAQQLAGALQNEAYGQTGNRAYNRILAERFGFDVGGEPGNVAGFGGGYDRSFQDHLAETGQTEAFNEYTANLPDHLQDPRMLDNLLAQAIAGDPAGQGDHQGPQNTPDFGNIGLREALGMMFNGYTPGISGEGPRVGGFKNIGMIDSKVLFPGAFYAMFTGEDPFKYQGWGGKDKFDGSQTFGGGDDGSGGAHKPDGGPGLGYGR